jgi:uncharacterized protein (TIGR00299 family) protein
VKIAYCEASSGISGDMFLAALLDAGMPLDVLTASLQKLSFDDEWQVQLNRVSKGAVSATSIDVIVRGSHHHHRHPADIQRLINSSGLPKKVQDTSLRIFQYLAEAEASVHGTSVEEVHFHEVGAVDSIIDIVGAAVGLEYLGIQRLYSSPLPLGSGQVDSQHGLLPLPAPATLLLLERAQAKTVPSPAQVELVTPTGAAILAALATFEQPAMSIHKVGTGAGKRDLPWPNILRLMVGEVEEAALQPMVEIATNIDDMNPQAYAPVMARLFAAGALDVYFTPIQMKKNRPAAILSVIAHKADEATLAQIILRETTTFGVRIHPISRVEARREFVQVQTPYGEVAVKVKILDGQPVQYAPEFEDCARLASQNQVPFLKVYQSALLAVDTGETHPS